ncbi:dihydroxyacetone kinase family protein [Actinomycetospora termitidis]|uniref:Dihydroxyacetone kinase family protein n=1 Tax=Actinomycetospora termitidis TaxID=3053470 RepID=A0ABT7MDS6_9PSEU|nr:dihydroxyacetone kinase family protein [Actinomycetospora sp. Odt1-22]MDL5158821.1 dihydroxyacetone kinase family protein [Actinomycetospora sp. Odt1-22]
MKKLINAPGDVVAHALEGVVRSTPGAALVEGTSVLVRTDLPTDQVAVLCGGGSGHEPAHAGYVGPGHLAGAVCGEVFASPSADAVLSGIRAFRDHPGVLLVVMNYTGDRLNFGLAAQLARAEGIACEMVTVADDVALDADDDVTAGRRGLAGTVLVTKVAGAAAAAGVPLDEVARAARETAGAVGTMGVALSAATVPSAGEPGFVLEHDEIEIGLGIHGEQGVRRESLRPADELVDEVVETVCADRGFARGDRVAVLVNGTGATPPMELSILLRRALENLESRGIGVERAWAGTFLSSIDMAGFSVAVLGLDDERLARLDAPARSAAWPSGSGTVAGGVPTVPDAGVDEAGDLAPSSGVPAPADLRARVEAVCAAVRDAEPRLTELDTATGDGDLGTSLLRGADAVGEELDSYRWDDPVAVLRGIAATLRRAIGGTSGPLYATGLLHAAEHLADGGSWATALQAGADGVSDLGGAKAGDRTMLDALFPAASALAASRSVDEALSAAREGAAATETMAPRRGRSSYLGDRVHGHRDAGAEAVTVWLAALASEA